MPGFVNRQNPLPVSEQPIQDQEEMNRRIAELQRVAEQRAEMARIMHEMDVMRQTGATNAAIGFYDQTVPFPLGTATTSDHTFTEEQALLALQMMRDADRRNAAQQQQSAYLNERVNQLFRDPLGYGKVLAETDDLHKAEQAVISRELAKEFVRSVTMEGADATIIGQILDALACDKCQDGWKEIDGKKGEFELCECATEADLEGVA